MSVDTLANTFVHDQLAGARRASRIAILLDFCLSLAGIYLVIDKPIPDLLPISNPLGGFSGVIGFSLIYFGLALSIIYAVKLDRKKKSLQRDSRRKELSKEKVIISDRSDSEANRLLEQLRKSENPGGESK